MPHSGFVMFILHKLHEFFLKNKFPVSPSAMWLYPSLYILSSKRKPCWTLHCYFLESSMETAILQSKTPLTTTPPLYLVSTWNSSAPNQSPTMFEKADEQLCSVGASFFLISSAMLSPLSAVLFHHTLSISWNNLWKPYPDPSYKAGAGLWMVLRGCYVSAWRETKR